MVERSYPVTGELSRCPFCGGKPYLNGPDNPGHEYWISCQSCGASSLMRSNYDATKAAWNARLDAVAQEARDPSKAIEFLEWLIGFTGAVRTHPLNAYGNKILRDKVEKLGAELGIYTEGSTVPSTERS